MSEKDSILKLMWNPLALPRAAARMEEERAARLAMVGWGFAAGLVCAQNALEPAGVWSRWECARVYVATGLCCGVFAAAVAAMVIALSSAPGQDLTTELQRAQRRVLYLLPLISLTPLLVWSLCAAVLRKESGFTPDVITVAGSRATLIALFALMLALSMWATSRTRRMYESDTCFYCGYPLLGLSEPRCPECGHPFDAAKLARVPK